jgi:hypothetical protein
MHGRRLVGTLAALCLAAGLIPTLGLVTAQAGTITQGPLSVMVENQYLKRDCDNYSFPFSVTLSASYEWDLWLDGQDPSGRSEIGGIESGKGSGSGDLAPFACPETGFAYALTFRLELHDPDTYAVVMTYKVSTSWSVIRSTTTTTANLSRSTVPTGEAVVIYGKVTAGPGPYAGRPAGDETVKLQRRYKGSSTWKTVWTMTTNPYGRYRQRVGAASGHSFYLRVRYVGDEVLRPSTSPARLVRVT